MKKAERSGLPFFGIGKIIPYLARYKKRVYAMLFCGLLGSVVDIAQPILQRYSINHFIGGGTLDTLPWFIAIYFGTICTITMTSPLRRLPSRAACPANVCGTISAAPRRVCRR